MPHRSDYNKIMKFTRIQRSNFIYGLIFGSRVKNNRLLAALSSRNREKNAALLDNSMPSGYMTGQGRGGAVDKLRFGFSTMGTSGCEVMAAYNALKKAGQDPDLTELIAYMEKRGASFGGAFGTSPIAIAQFLKDRGLKARLLRSAPGMDLADWDRLLDGALCGVFTFWWREDSLMIHTVMVEKTGPALRAFNFTRAEDISLFGSLEDMVTKRRLIPISLVIAEDNSCYVTENRQNSADPA